MDDQFDVIIVGARCAGSPLATLLARSGLSVCLLDRDRFPSDTPSTHGIQPAGTMALERLGVGASVQAVAARIERGTFVLDDTRLDVDRLSSLVGAPMLNVRRIALDAILIEAAAAAGVDVRTETPVVSVLEQGGRVAGVKTTSGEIRARLVVGADGARSTVARLVGAREYDREPAGRVFVWGYFDGAQADSDRVWLGKIGDHSYLASPTDAGLFMAAITVSVDRWKQLRVDREGAYRAALEGWPELRTALERARRVGRLQVMAHWHGFFRESAGPGWVLVGDAGHFKDPTPGQGISDALRQVEQLAPAIERALHAGQAAPLVQWWRWRDLDAREMYWFGRDMGAAGPTPMLLKEMQRKLASDSRMTEALVRVINHDLPPSKLFTPALALAATARALAKHPGHRRALLREAWTLAREDVRHSRPSSLTPPASRHPWGRRLMGRVAPG